MGCSRAITLHASSDRRLISHILIISSGLLFWGPEFFLSLINKKRYLSTEIKKILHKNLHKIQNDSVDSKKILKKY